MNRMPETAFVKSRDVRTYMGIGRGKMEALIDQGVLKPHWPRDKRGKEIRSMHPLFLRAEVLDAMEGMVAGG